MKGRLRYSMKTYKKIIKTLLISSLFLFPAQGYAHDYVNVADSQLPIIVPCYIEHNIIEYKLDRTSVYSKDKNHVNVLVYKFENDELIGRFVYQYRYKDGQWEVLTHDNGLPDVIYVNKRGKVEQFKANLSWMRASIWPEHDSIIRIALTYANK